MLFGAQANYCYHNNLCTSDTICTDTMDTGIVQHPPSKRPLDMRHTEGAPRAKRRFEKVAARFEQFHISSDPSDVPIGSMESSSDDDEVLVGDDCGPSITQQPTNIVVEEPEEEDASTSKRLRLTDELHEYLEKAKEEPLLWKKLSEHTKVSEGALTIWRPPVPAPNPFDDPSMKGRIYEVTENDLTDEEVIDEDGDIVLDEEAWRISHGIRPTVSYPDDVYRESPGTVDSTLSTVSSSPVPSPSFSDDEVGYCSRIVELDDGGTTTDSSLEDDAMDMD